MLPVALLVGAALAILAPASAQAGAISLRITASDGAGHHRAATLRCDSDGPRTTGFLRGRDAAKLCRRAYALKRFLSSAPDTDRACTEIYGGPDRARVRGFIQNADVDRRFGRADGCEIADWDVAQRLLPRPVDAAP
jgi:hypothetical protein